MLVALYRGINTREPTVTMTAIDRGDVNHPDRDWIFPDLRAHVAEVLGAPDRFAGLKAAAPDSGGGVPVCGLATVRSRRGPARRREL